MPQEPDWNPKWDREGDGKRDPEARTSPSGESPGRPPAKYIPPPPIRRWIPRWREGADASVAEYGEPEQRRDGDDPWPHGWARREQPRPPRRLYPNVPTVDRCCCGCRLMPAVWLIAVAFMVIGTVRLFLAMPDNMNNRVGYYLCELGNLHNVSDPSELANSSIVTGTVPSPINSEENEGDNNETGRSVGDDKDYHDHDWMTTLDQCAADIDDSLHGMLILMFLLAILEIVSASLLLFACCTKVAYFLLPWLLVATVDMCASIVIAIMFMFWDIHWFIILAGVVFILLYCALLAYLMVVVYSYYVDLEEADYEPEDENT